ncbi:MAG: hypothetical protein CML73_00420, partial [Rhodobiaceae bacterium]|nr:hypothetical protein [Rhodobiaceae bacterium]
IFGAWKGKAEDQLSISDFSTQPTTASTTTKTKHWRREFCEKYFSIRQRVENFCARFLRGRNGAWMARFHF